MKKMSITAKAILGLSVTATVLLASNIQQYRQHERQQLTLLQAEQELNHARAQNKKLTARVESLRRMEPTTTGMYQKHLRGIIRATLQHMGCKQVADWERLLLLTVAAESNMGTWTRQLHGPARGIVQVEPKTERCVLNWLQKNRPDLYARIKILRVPAKLAIHEAEYNTSYALAVCYGVYVMRKVDPKGKDATSLAGIYKAKYNTAKGKATVEGVLAKLDTFGVRI